MLKGITNQSWRILQSQSQHSGRKSRVLRTTLCKKDLILISGELTMWKCMTMKQICWLSCYHHETSNMVLCFGCCIIFTGQALNGTEMSVGGRQPPIFFLFSLFIYLFLVGGRQLPGAIYFGFSKLFICVHDTNYSRGFFWWIILLWRQSTYIGSTSESISWYVVVYMTLVCTTRNKLKIGRFSFVTAIRLIETFGSAVGFARQAASTMTDTCTG